MFGDGDYFLTRCSITHARTFYGLLWAGDIMRALLLIAINLHASQVLTRRHVSSSDESIENLLYYKDCNHKAKEPPPVPLLRAEPPPPPKPPDCPFPKMCCSMSCGNECGSQQSFLSRQMEPLQNLQPLQAPPIHPRQPQIPVQPPIAQHSRKNKMKVPMDMQLPLGARRGFGLTKEKIKSLISQDNDIRKILKDLVRVTMQKVDLLEMVNARRTTNKRNSDTSLNSDDYDSFVH